MKYVWEVQVWSHDTGKKWTSFYFTSRKRAQSEVATAAFVRFLESNKSCERIVRISLNLGAQIL
jgi:hypothetical protein